MTPRRLTALALLAIITLTTALHLAGLRRALPYAPEADEQNFLGIAVTIVASGDPNPGWFGHPGSTVLYPLAAALWIGDQFGAWGPPNSINPEFLDRTDGTGVKARRGKSTVSSAPYMLGRALTAAYGIASVAVLYFLGRRLFSSAVGLISALVLGVLPIHVGYAQILRSDSAAVFFSLLALYACVVVYERPSLRRSTVAGLLIGLATASRYFLVTLVPVLAAVVLIGLWRTGQSRSTLAKRAFVVGIGGIAAAMASFFVSSPYVLLDFNTALGNLQFEARSRQLGADGFSKLENLQWYLLDALPTNLTRPVAAMALVGIVIALKRRRELALVLIGFMSIFVLGISQSALHWNRWVIQVLPVGIIFAAVGLVEVARWARAKSRDQRWIGRAVLGLGTLALAAMPLLQTVLHDVGQLYPTRIQARDWLAANTQPGDKVAQEGYGPALAMAPFEINVESRLFAGALESYQQSGYKYLVFSNWSNERILAEPARYPQENARYQELFGGTTFAAEFLPPAERLGTLPLLGALRCNCSPIPVPGGPIIQIRRMPESAVSPTDAGAASAIGEASEPTSPGGPPDPSLYARLPGEDLAAFERRLRDLAARDLLPSGPGGRFITEAVERERQLEAAPNGATP